MFDCHYDLLMYICISRNDVEKIKKYCERIFKKDNITGGIFNICYTGKYTIENSIGLKEEEADVVQNLKMITRLIDEYKIIPQDINYILGIEGLDYLKNVDDIDELYKLGLRSTNIVWNNPNKFGGGTKADCNLGLTELGKELVEKLVKTNIAIDLSHTNEKTFYGIIEEARRLRTLGYNPIIHASHSNAKGVCRVARNITDDQIKIIAKEFNGTIGVVEYTPFVKQLEEDDKIDFLEMEKYYIKHINYIRDLLGDVDNIAVSTDDMTYIYDQEERPPVYKHEEVAKKIRELLENNGYTNEEVETIMRKNFESKILTRLL